MECIKWYFNSFSSVQSLSSVQLCATPWTATRQASLSIANSQSLLKLMSIESVMSSSVIPFSSHLQCFPASRSFPRSQFFISGGQSIRVSVSASVLPMNIQDSFLQYSFLQDWLVWSPCSPRDSQVSSPTPQCKASILQSSAFFIVQLSHPYTTTGKTIALIDGPCWQSNVSAFEYTV